MNKFNSNKQLGWWVIFNSSYPYYYFGKDLVKVTSLVFIIAFLFNYLFEPFHVNYSEHRMNYLWISLIHAFVPILVLALFPAIGSTFEQLTRKWSIKKEIIFILLFFLITGVIQFLIRDLIYDNPNNWSNQYLIEEVRNFFLIGILIVLIVVPWNYNRLNLRNQKKASILQKELEQLRNPKKQKATVDISTQLKSDDFKLNLDNFLYAKADGNYTEVYSMEGEIPSRFIKRMTLSSLEKQLVQTPHIFRSHRSYLVNLKKVDTVKGNAQGYLISLIDSTEDIPVARNQLGIFDRKMLQLK